MTDTITPQSLLKRAAAIITERGWYQGHYIDDQGQCVCPLGALHIAYAEALGLRNPARHVGSWPEGSRPDPLQEAVNGLQDSISTRDWVADWNDAPGRTKEDVLSALRAAAEES